MEGVVPIKERASASNTEPPQSKRPERGERNERPERGEGVQRGERLERPQKRMRKRHSFDIYIDQYERLTALKLQAMLRGEERGLAKMVREALDAYLAQEE